MTRAKNRPSWKSVLKNEKPLLLPCAHDALSARLIERAGFAAYSIGGYALVGARYAIPDIGLAAFAEISAGVRDIMAATDLPVLVDADTGYGDVKNVAHTIENYERMGEDEIKPRLLLNGEDLIAAGYRPGPRFREMLIAAEDAQLEGSIATREQALELVHNRFGAPDAIAKTAS